MDIRYDGKRRAFFDPRERVCVAFIEHGAAHDVAAREIQAVYLL